LNNGDGTFQSAVNCEAGDGPTSVFCADFDNDLDNDISVANLNSNNVSILFNKYPLAIITLDRSGSMVNSNPVGQSRFERAKILAHSDVDKLLDVNDSDYPGEYFIAVMYFNNEGTVLNQDFTIDAEALHDAIDELPQPRNSTPLAAAMCRAHCDLIDVDGRFVFTYTDGLENNSPEFDLCEICEPCNQYIESGWNYDCNPEIPSSCTDWQLCLTEKFTQSGENIIRYFGEPINPFNKNATPDGLEDIYFLKTTAEESSITIVKQY